MTPLSGAKWPIALLVECKMESSVAEKDPFNNKSIFSITTILYRFYFPDGCDPPLWSEVAESSAGGGLPQSNVATVTDCQSLCIQNVDCQGLDWEPGSDTKCWLHIGSIGSQRDTPGITHYILRDRCPQRKQTLFG